MLRMIVKSKEDINFAYFITFATIKKFLIVANVIKHAKFIYT